MLDTPPTVLVVPDSFKGCLPAADVAAAMAQGVELALGDNSTIIQLPFADGGEGTLDALTAHWAVAPRQINTVDAVGRPRIARYGISTDSTTGIIEAAEANGLPHVADLPSRPMRADSFGVGIIARELLDRGVDEILLCIGGSASTDGGTGILRALGASFLDSAGNEVPPGGGGLAHVYEIDDTKLHPRARQVMWRIATDVDNPLCGKHGAAEVFGPQKGASPSEVAVLDAGLAQLAKVLDEKTGMDVSNRAGTGAAGGVPACLVPLVGAEMVPGADLVADMVGLRALAEPADLILTGEGAFDAQSLRGKVVQGVLRAAPVGVPVVVIAGSVGLTASESRAAGVTAAFSIATGPSDLAGLARDASSLIQDVATHVTSLFTKSCLHKSQVGQEI